MASKPLHSVFVIALPSMRASSGPAVKFTLASPLLPFLHRLCCQVRDKTYEMLKAVVNKSSRQFIAGIPENMEEHQVKFDDMLRSVECAITMH